MIGPRDIYATFAMLSYEKKETIATALRLLRIKDFGGRGRHARPLCAR